MNAVKVSLDYKKYNSKPSGGEIGRISKEIYKKTCEISLDELADLVGNDGCTFAPAVFANARTIAEVKEIQLLCLDFDNKEKNISIDRVLERSDKLDLPIAFAYETFSSQECSRFRVVYRYFEPIVSIEFYNILMNILLELFPEADRAAKDCSRMFFGGKGLIVNVSNAVIYPDRLFSALYITYSGNNKDKVRRIERFASANNIQLINNTFNAHTVSLDKVKSLETPIIYNNIDNSNGFPDEVFVIHKTDKESCTNRQVRFSDTMIKNIASAELCNSCTLVKELANGTRWLYYNELWGILTNLVHINGGIKYFRKIMTSLRECTDLPYDYDKWYSNCTQISKCPYAPKRCEDFCPHSNECEHGKNIITTVKTMKNRITVIDNKISYTDIGSARQELYRSLLKAMFSADNHIHVIKAQTGIGKTHTYIRCIKELGISCIIAVPTNDLKNEVCRRMKANGIDVKATPELPCDISDDDKEALECLYRKGDLYSYREFMRELEKRYNSIKLYREELRKVMQYEGNIVTTHFRLLYQFREEVLQSHTIIIDENILQTMFHTDCADISELEYIRAQFYIKGHIRKRLKYYMSSKKKEYKKHINEPYIHLSRRTRRFISKDDNITIDLEVFLNASATVVDDDKVYYAWLKELPKQKIIVMSATVDSEVYAEFFKNRQIINYDIPEAKYKGTILQYTDNSFSRTWIENHTEEFENIRKRYADKDCYEICFKKYEAESTDLHFGNTQGKDSYSDKDLVILGTPFPNDKLCRLMAASMNYDISIINNESINFREVSYEQYRFYFSTFEDSLLQRIHIYLIAEELEQSIGRARLLNKENTVYVYSRFPAKQAIFIENDNN